MHILGWLGESLSIVAAVTVFLVMSIGMSVAMAISLISVVLMVVVLVVAVPPALLVPPTVLVVIPMAMRPIRILKRRAVIVSADPTVVRPIGSPISGDPVSLWVGGNRADLIPQWGRRSADIDVNLSARGQSKTKKCGRGKYEQFAHESDSLWVEAGGVGLVRAEQRS